MSASASFVYLFDYLLVDSPCPKRHGYAKNALRAKEAINRVSVTGSRQARRPTVSHWSRSRNPKRFRFPTAIAHPLSCRSPNGVVNEVGHMPIQGYGHAPRRTDNA